MPRQKPSSVQRRPRRRRGESPEEEWRWVTDSWPTTTEAVRDAGLNPFFQFIAGREEERELWEAYRADVLASWVRERPGTRPRLWWRHDAPRWTNDPWGGWHLHGELAVPRKRVGGTGTPKHEATDVPPRFKFGLPVEWEDDVDPLDPPTFESEAVYLKRHGLLADGEEARIPPDAWEPEAINLNGA